MLPASLKLMVRTESNFFQKAKKRFGQHLSVYFLYSSPLLQAKGAVIVPKKQIPLATQRNTLKRKIKSILSQELKVKKGIKLVVLARGSAGQLTYSELENELKNLIP